MTFSAATAMLHGTAARRRELLLTSDDLPPAQTASSLWARRALGDVTRGLQGEGRAVGLPPHEWGGRDIVRGLCGPYRQGTFGGPFLGKAPRMSREGKGGRATAPPSVAPPRESKGGRLVRPHANVGLSARAPFGPRAFRNQFGCGQLDEGGPFENARQKIDRGGID